MPSFWPSLRSPGDSFWLEGRLDWHDSHGIVGGCWDPTGIRSPSLSCWWSKLNWNVTRIKSRKQSVIFLSLQLYTSSSDTLEAITSSIWNKTLERQDAEKSNSITKEIFFIIVLLHCLLDGIFSDLHISNIFYTNRTISIFLDLSTLKLFVLASIIIYKTLNTELYIFTRSRFSLLVYFFIKYLCLHLLQNCFVQLPQTHLDFKRPKWAGEVVLL